MDVAHAGRGHLARGLRGPAASGARGARRDGLLHRRDVDVRVGGAGHRGRELEEMRTAPSRVRDGRSYAALAVQPTVIVDAGDHYETGTFSWSRRAVTLVPEKIPKNGNAPQVAAARRDNNIRAFLVWARFPFWTIEPTPSGTRVTVSDMRFPGRNGLPPRRR